MEVEGGAAGVPIAIPLICSNVMSLNVKILFVVMRWKSAMMASAGHIEFFSFLTGLKIFSTEMDGSCCRYVCVHPNDIFHEQPCIGREIQCCEDLP